MEFEMSDLGLMTYFLGMEIEQSHSVIFISQRKYIFDVLKRFNLNQCKAIATPFDPNMKLSKEDDDSIIDTTIYRSLVGSLLFLTSTRPDIMFSASFLSRFMNSPSNSHFMAAKRVLKYLKGTSNYGLLYSNNENAKLEGYVDSDWASSVEDMKSTSSYLFSLGLGYFSWISKKQEVVTQYTAEAEYIAAAAASNQAIWLRRLLADFKNDQSEATLLWCDNKLTIAIANNPVQHSRTKHILVKYHAIREAKRN
ncbi:secreted RxLR effector protein 161-like [Manihot esculenta]|uniref:secreted RxLR effector protein 161-like n=1 Tax=Manihot esculenta TaxID=3983 RepID=UPI001CC7FA35|nr:secreted RxLR effector protein 161-like [Manihot esculenta]